MENQDFNQLIEELNNMEYIHSDLLSVAVDYTSTYLRHTDSQKALLESLWEQPSFVNQAANSVRESLIIATQALILSEEVPFDKLVTELINKEEQKQNIENLKLNPVQNKALNHYFDSLKKEVFSRIYHSNKELRKVTELKKTLLQSRYDTFMDFFPE